MNLTETLRAHLTDYDRIDEYTTVARLRGTEYVITEEYDGAFTVRTGTRNVSLERLLRVLEGK